MAPPFESLIGKVEAARADLRPSEEKLARLVLADPLGTLDLTMDEFAARAGVSAPTVARFCAAVGCNGFRAFKIRLAQDRGYGLPFVHPDVTEDDGVGAIAQKVFERTMGELMTVRGRLSATDIEKAVAILAQATRIEFYGSGNSGIVAQDFQHKFFRLGIATAAYVDPHIFCMSALTLQPGHVVVLISNSGRNHDLLDAARDALSVGADVIAITHSGSPLAALASVAIAIDVAEDADVYTPMTSRIAQLVICDVLAIAVAQHKGEPLRNRLERSKQAVRRRRLVAG